MKKIRKKRVLIWLSILSVSLLIISPGFCGERGVSVEDITKEVLTGPSDLDPDKILGPGGIGIKTHKNLLMSFGATVRLIPTSETDWDFGLSNKVPGYFNTEPIKSFAGNSLDTATAVQSIYKNSIGLSDAINNNRGNDAIISGYENFSTAFFKANEITSSNPTLNPTISALASSMQTINDTASQAVQGIAVPVANPVADAAATAAAAAAIQPGATLETITAAATAAARQAADAITAGFTDPQQQAIASVSANAAVTAGAAAAATSAGTTATVVYNQGIQNGLTPAAAAAAAQQAAEAAARASAGNAAADASSEAAKATVINAAVSTPNAALGNANLLQTAEALAAGVAQTVNHDPNATAQDLTGSVAYLTALKAKTDSFKPYYLANSFLKAHSNESGSVKDGYTRVETKMYFNAMPKDKKWSFYAALEYDRPIDTETVDARGGKNESSNFGLERLNASIELYDGLRLHAGWDIWGIDIIEAGSFVYGDDNPGFWIKGDYKPIDFSIAWLKLEENDFQLSPGDHLPSKDADRDLYAGYLDYKFREKDKVRAFFAWDRIRNVHSADLTGAIAAQAGLADFAGIYGNNGIVGSEATLADTDAYTLGAYYLGNFGIVELMVEGAYKFGSADDTGLQGVDNGVSIIQYNDFDISAYALSADVAVELKEKLGWYSLKPHIGFLYTSGDDDPNDDSLGGWTGITSAQRFSRMWGGENTIVGDTNLVLGSALYGYIPEFHGNGTPVFTGGIQNFSGSGSGRGDNPGLSLLSAGITLRPKIFFIYRTNLNAFWWNEDFYVANMVNTTEITADGALRKTRYSRIDSGYAGLEWDNEITLALAKHMFVKGQFSFFFPGSAVKDVTKALSGGQEADDTAMRLAGEFIWNF